MELSIWDPVRTGMPAGRETLGHPISMVRLFTAAGLLRVRSLAHLFIPERSIQGTVTTHGPLATVPGGVALVIFGASQACERPVSVATKPAAEEDFFASAALTFFTQKLSGHS